MARLVIEGFSDVNDAIKCAKQVAVKGSEVLGGMKVNMAEQPWLQITYDGDVTIKIIEVPGWKAGDSGPEVKV